MVAMTRKKTLQAVAIGQRLSETIERVGMSNLALAEKSGLSDGYISRIRRGERSPGTDKLKRLADALGVDANWLAWGGQSREVVTGQGQTDLEDVLRHYEWPKGVDSFIADEVTRIVRSEALSHGDRPISVWKLRIQELIEAAGRAKTTHDSRPTTKSLASGTQDEDWTQRKKTRAPTREHRLLLDDTSDSRVHRIGRMLGYDDDVSERVAMRIAALSGEITDEEIAKLFGPTPKAKLPSRPAVDPGKGGGFAGKLPNREKPAPSDDDEEDRPKSKINVPRVKR